MRVLQNGDGALPVAARSVFPSRPDDTDSRMPWVLVVLMVLRVVLAGSLGLTFDEAYYFSWAQHPQLGYLDHPPLVAWLVSPVVTWAPPDPLLARLPILLLSLPFTWFVFASTRDVVGARVAWHAVVLVNALPSVALSFILIAPDAPLLTSWAASLHAFQRALQRNTPAAWLAAGLATGVALLSKYMAVLLFPTFALLLLWRRRSLLRDLWPWLALVVALLVFSPVLVWNAQRNWLSFRFQLGLGPRHGDDVTGLLSLLDFVAGQAAGVTPAVLVGLVLAWRARRHAPHDVAFRLLTFSCAVPLVIFTTLAWRHPLEVNWVTCAWVGAAPVVALLAPRCARIATIIGLIVLLGAAAYVPRPFLPSTHDITARGEGWETVAAAVRHCLDERGLRTAVVLGHKRYETAQMQFHLGRDLPVRPAHRGERYAFLPEATASHAVLLIRPTDATPDLVETIARDHGHARAESCAEVTRRRPGGEPLETFRVLLLRPDGAAARTD
ncbi:MAG: glycosyltransferase family 39 protein [Myxococcota bacterium]